jgi:V/A-type H+-transporting ATPase subunit I
MTIVPMQRITVCGPIGAKAAALEAMQALGVLHLIPLRAADPLALGDMSQRRSAETAVRHIFSAPVQKRPYRPGTLIDVEDVIGKINANRQAARQLSDRRDETVAHIIAIAPWGDFVLPSLDEIGGERLWFYALDVKHRAALDKISLPWAIANRDQTVLYVVVISPDEPPADLLPVPRAHVGSTRLSELHRELDDIEIELDRVETERAELTRWRLLLGAEYAAAQDRGALRDVAGQTLDIEELFVLQGWAPAGAALAIEGLAKTQGLAVIIDPPGKDEKPPTLLHTENPRLASANDLTNFYTSPGYNGWDPSIIVFVSFAAFFAMILADAGYAALIGLITAWYWRRMGASAGGRRIRALLVVVVGASLLYGIAAGSYFGIELHQGSFLKRLAFIDITDLKVMMRVSVLIGAFHIGLALAIVGWIHRGTGESLHSFGWIGVIVGALLLWLGSGSLQSAGTVVLVCGFLAAFWGSAIERPITKPTDWLLRGFDGLLSITHVTKILGDVLSYLRLFALGLASASLAETFNHMAGNVETTRPGLGLLLALIILLFGHSINFVIGIMGGVVHGLRLNYIEFFGWGLSEEGYPFRAFAKKEAPE